MFMKKAEVGDQGAKRGVYRQGRHCADVHLGRIETEGRFELKYGGGGRIKVPKGKGIWPAFWLLGTDFKAVGWPACGEIDIMENVGSEPPRSTAACTALGTRKQSIGLHVHAAQPSSIQRRLSCFCDRVGAADSALLRGRCSYETQTRISFPGYAVAFDHPFFVVLDLAIGGYWRAIRTLQLRFRRPCWWIMCGCTGWGRTAEKGKP